MNKAAPRSVRGSYTTQRAVRQPARATTATDRATREADMPMRDDGTSLHQTSRERVDAVTSRLERMSEHQNTSWSSRRGEQEQPRVPAPSPLMDRLSAAATPRDADRSTASAEALARYRRARASAAETSASVPVPAAPMPVRAVATSTPEVDTAETLMLQRRIDRSNRRTDEALASIAEMMETSEARRQQERDAVAALTAKMSSLEHKLADQIGATEYPIRGALARLEARLDIIGKRSTMEQNARRSAVHPGPDAESVRRLEDKLNSIIDAFQIAPAQRSASSEIALEAARAPSVASADRSLTDAISEITRRQQALEQANMREPVAEAANFALDDSRDMARDNKSESQGASRNLYRLMPKSAVNALEGSLRLLASRMDKPGAARPDAVATRRAINPAMPPSLRPNDPSFDKFEQRLNALAGKVDDALARMMAATDKVASQAGTATLEGIVRDLGAKIEAMAAPDSGKQALDALQSQVEMLATRFERSEHGLSALPALAASVRELFGQLESTRASLETTAAKAAREVLRIAIDDGKARAPRQAITPQLIKDMVGDVTAPAADKSLTTVNKMLDDVVDHLAELDRPVAPIKAAGATVRTTPPANKPVAAREQRREPIASAPPRAVPVPRQGATDKAKGRSGVATDGGQRADFIAAARRAARTARGDASATARADSISDPRSRIRLLTQSRDFVAAHKRPLVMALAAVLMVVGTIALVQRSDLGAGTSVAGKDAMPAVIASEPMRSTATAVPTALATRVVPSEGNEAATPNQLPRTAALVAAPDAATDPIQTGSIAPLPAFAAVNGAPRPSGLPAGLIKAAEDGNGAAQYDIGVRLTEGRGVPRDPRSAVDWLEKASAQGVAPARYRLASMYEKGIAVTPDKARAKLLYTAAAEAGNPRAMHNLAVMLADGDGHPDYAAAASWFRRAASFGIHDSQFNLAILLARGLGVPQSLTQSYQWFAIAAAQDDSDAAHKRDEVGAKLTANELSVAKAFAVAFRPKPVPPGATDIVVPVGGWAGAAGGSHLNTAKKVAS